MSNITAGQLAAKLQLALNVASSLDPRIALASAGVNALSDLFGTTSEVRTMMDQVYSETEANAPEVAQKVSDFYTAKSDAVKKSFRDHPGT